MIYPENRKPTFPDHALVLLAVLVWVGLLAMHPGERRWSVGAFLLVLVLLRLLLFLVAAHLSFGHGVLRGCRWVSRTRSAQSSSFTVPRLAPPRLKSAVHAGAA